MTDSVVEARAIEAGAIRFLHTSASVEEIVYAVRRAAHGQKLSSPPKFVDLHRYAQERQDQTSIPDSDVFQLTPRERDVLEALSDGLSDVRSPIACTSATRQYGRTWQTS